MTDSIGRGARLALLAVVLIVPTAVRAQGSKDSSDVKGTIALVRRLYEDLEYERALKEIERARRMSPNVETNVTLNLYEGIILAELIRMDDANDAFRAALLLDPDAKLPVRVSPKLQQNFEFVRIEVQQELALLHDRREAQRRFEESSAQQEPKPEVATTAESPVTPIKTEAVAEGNPRSRALIPAIVGGVFVAAGGVSYGLARREQSKLRGDDPDLATRADAHASASRGRTLQTVGLGLLGGGVVGLGVASGLYLLGSPSQPMSLGVGTDGTSAFVSGSWQ